MSNLNYLTQYLLKVTLIVFLHLVINDFTASAQSAQTNITGLVVDQNGAPLSGASVMLNAKAITKTDSSGKFEIQFPKSTVFSLSVSAQGKISWEKKITTREISEKLIRITLTDDIQRVEAVDILGMTKVDVTNKLAFNVTAIDARKSHNTTMDVGQVLNRVSGVKVRETGGVGSDVSFNLNGFSGNQVKMFMDGIPMDNYGSSFQLNNIPINYVDQIEVYRGVVPVWLGGDALGGAINLVRTNRVGKYIDVSYSFGSFQTHKVNLNAGITTENGFSVELAAYKNNSKNNYWVLVDVVPDINSGVTIEDKVRRFHDQYNNDFFNLNLGVRNKSWADHLLFGFNFGDNRADIQTGNRMAEVYGARFRDGQLLQPTVSYKKNNFLIQRLDIQIDGNYNFGQERVIDTVYRRFNWYGNSIPKGNNTWDLGGERKNEFYVFRNNNANAVMNLKYSINGNNQIYVNNTFTSTDRRGTNELLPEDDFYKQPKKLQKNIIGLAFGNSDIRNLENQIFVKYYHQNVHAYQLENQVYSDFRDTRDLVGYGLASTYLLGDNTQFKFSYEKSYRLPTVNELFGDAVNLEANPQLGPENSNNFNLNASHEFSWAQKNALLVRTGGIYRIAKDFIRNVLSPVNNDGTIRQVAQNQRDVQNIGFDLEMRYAYDGKFFLGGNMTYQNLRNQTKYEGNSTDVSIFYKDRIPNIPYFFATGDVNYNWQNSFDFGGTLSVGASVNYVHEYFLRWPSAGSSGKEVIPKQLSYDATISYSMSNGKYNLALEGRNLSDELLYDNYMLQKPSRNFNVKFRYVIKD